MQPTATRTVFEVIAEFLAAEPVAQAILDYRLPVELEERAAVLVDRKRADQLTFDEEMELYDFIRADDMMTLLKAKTRARLSENS